MILDETFRQLVAGGTAQHRKIYARHAWPDLERLRRLREPR